MPEPKQKESGRFIEVCFGPNCRGIGGGAALLEIEELVQEDDVVPCQVSVVEGGCRDFCTLGPNVHIRSKNTIIESFHRVNGGVDCQHIVFKALSLKNNKHEIHQMERRIEPKESVNSMMLRRAQRLRWEALKDTSVKITECRKDMRNSGLSESSPTEESEKVQKKIENWKQSSTLSVASAIRAEASASKKIPKKERADRRGKRLNRIISEKFDQCLHFDELI